MTYICEICGKQFSRKTAPAVQQCKGCKREATYKSSPGLKQKNERLRVEGFQKKYGVNNPSKLKEVRQRISEKARERFSDDVIKSTILEKREATNIERYGCRSASQNAAVKEKNVATQMANNGYVGWQNEELREQAQLAAHSEAANERRKMTSMEHFGVDHPLKSEDVKAKQWLSYKDKTGYDHPAHNPEIRHSIKGYEFEGIHFDSSWELAYYIWLRDSKKAFIYHPPFFMDYVDDAGEQHKYQPDFLVEGKFIEIKGDHFFNEKGEPYNHYEKAFWWSKYNALVDNKIEILKFEEIRQYLRYVKETYGSDYLRSFKRR